MEKLAGLLEKTDVKIEFFLAFLLGGIINLKTCSISNIKNL